MFSKNSGKKWQTDTDREEDRGRESSKGKRVNIKISKQQPLPHIEIWDEKNHFLRRQRCRNKKHIPFHFVWFRFCITRSFLFFSNKFLAYYCCAGNVDADADVVVVVVLVLLSGTIISHCLSPLSTISSK